MNDYILEAEKIGNYLLDISIKNTEKKTYSTAMEKMAISFSKYEEIIWEKMLESNWKMACLDAGLALQDPTNNARRKIFTLLAILEASPNYTNYFFSKDFSFFYVFKIALVSLRAVIRAIVGLIYLKIIRKKCQKIMII